MSDRHLSIGDMIKIIPVEFENIKAKQEDTEESQDDNTSPASEDVTATCCFIKVEIKSDNEMPGYEEDPLRSDDYFQPSDSGDISCLAVLKKDQSDATADKCTGEPVVERDHPELYHNPLGLHTECVCDIALDIVKKESDVDAGAPVSKNLRLTTQMNYEDTPANNLMISYYTKDNVEEPKSETKRAVVDKPVKKNKIVKTRDKIDIRLRNNKQNDSTSDHNDAHKEMSEKKLSTGQSVNSSSSSKLKQLSCDICQKCFRRKGDLITHMRTHTGEKPHECNVCKKCFTRKHSLVVHMRAHTGEKHPYQCHVCEKYFSMKSNLDSHTRTHTGEKPYECNVCKKCFSIKCTLDNHMRTHTGEKPYECNICKKCFTDKGSLGIHTRTHTGEKPFQCHVCNKCFTLKGGLIRHSLTHNDEKPYQCNICKKFFSMKSNLDRHTRTHTGEKPFQCHVCNKCFTLKGGLIRHSLTHNDEKPYQCNICKKFFSMKSNLDRHTRTHTGEKPFQCHVCKKCFNRKAHLDIHIRTHTGEKPYQCKVCKKCFSEKKTLVTHIGLNTHQ